MCLEVDTMFLIEMIQGALYPLANLASLYIAVFYFDTVHWLRDVLSLAGIYI